MKHFNLAFLLAVLSFNLSAGHHEKEQQEGFTGLISSEVFDLAGEMDLYVEKYQSCGDAVNEKHYHPVGTLVYMIDGKAVSLSSGEWEEYSKGSYWFEPSMWVHGGNEPDQLQFGDNQCRQTLVIRASRKGEEPTVFVK